MITPGGFCCVTLSPHCALAAAVASDEASCRRVSFSALFRSGSCRAITFPSSSPRRSKQSIPQYGDLCEDAVLVEGDERPEAGSVRRSAGITLVGRLP